MIDMPQTPGTNAFRAANPTADFNLRTKWGDCATLPFSADYLTDANSPVDPANSGHAEYLKSMDPRSDLGKANRRNPNNSGYTSGLVNDL